MSTDSATQLNTLIKSGESETLEFKSSFGESAVETATAFANTHGGKIILGMADNGTPLAVINAICHRDYSDTANIQIKVHDDSLQIWSPGLLPYEMSIGDLLNPEHASRPRNRLIAQVFYDIGLIEQYGSGIGRMFKSCRDAQLPYPDLNNITGGFSISFKSVSGQVTGQVEEWIIKVLNACQTPQKSSEIQILTGVRHRETFQRNYLDYLLSEELLKRTIPEKPRSRLQKYWLTDKGRNLLKNGR